MPGAQRPASIGELYGKISVSGEDFSQGQSRLIREPEHAFVRLCRRLYSISPSLGRGGIFSEENRAAVAFLKWKLSPEVFSGASKIFLLIVLAVAIAAGSIPLFVKELSGIISLFSADETTRYLIAYLPFMLLALGSANFFNNYPLSEAKREQTRALTYVPEMLGYMVMSIKLVPNLEKAVEFAAQHGKGKIAKDFRDLIWDVQIGVYNSLSEGLDALAYRWGKYSSEFKRALMRVRASVIETTEAKRYDLLDQTMAEMLESIRNKMEQYARDLSQPSTMLFYIGVLLPLLLIIILPVGSSFSNAPLANPIVLFTIYNILIPLITVAFAYSLLQNRPPTYDPPVIPDDYAGLPPKWHGKIGGFDVDVRFAAILLAVLGLSISFFVSTQGIPPKFMWEQFGISDRGEQWVASDLSPQDALVNSGRRATYFALDDTGQRYKELLGQELARSEDADAQAISERVGQQVAAEEQLFYSQSENDVAPYKLVFGVLITLSLAVFVALHYSGKYKRKIQLEVQEMESEFKDTLYVLASRMGENKPVEDAMKHVTEFLPDMKVSRLVFARTLDNIKLLGMPLEAAVFDQNNGSVAKIPSTIIKGSMKMLVDSVQLGVNVAARTMISLSIQLQNAEKVSSTLKVLVSDVTGTMRTMTLFIAPIVLGITTSLQRVVILTISSIASSDIIGSSTASASSVPGVNFSGLSASNFISAKSIASIATPTQFILIVALYIVELVVIMTYFTTKIEEDNDLLVKMNIALYLPIAITMFVVTMILSNLLVGSI